MLISEANMWIIGMVNRCTELARPLLPEERFVERMWILDALNQAEHCACYHEIWKLAVENKYFALMLGRIFAYPFS